MNPSDRPVPPPKRTAPVPPSQENKPKRELPEPPGGHYNTLPQFDQQNAAGPTLPKANQAPQQPHRADLRAVRDALARLQSQPLEFEAADRRHPDDAKQRGNIDVQPGFKGVGHFVADTGSGLLFKMQGREMNDGLVKFTPEQSNELKLNDAADLIKTSMENGRDGKPVEVKLQPSQFAQKGVWTVSDSDKPAPPRKKY